MAPKVRKQIYLEVEQDAALKRYAQELGLSEAAIIRLAIDHHTQLIHPQEPDRQAWQQERRFMQQLIQQGPVIGQRSWRREDLYDR